MKPTIALMLLQILELLASTVILKLAVVHTRIKSLMFHNFEVINYLFLLGNMISEMSHQMHLTDSSVIQMDLCRYSLCLSGVVHLLR